MEENQGTVYDQEKELEEAKRKIQKLNKQLLQLWCYLKSEDMWKDAQEYLEEHEDEELPFETKWIM